MLRKVRLVESGYAVQLSWVFMGESETESQNVRSFCRF